MKMRRSMWAAVAVMAFIMATGGSFATLEAPAGLAFAVQGAAQLSNTPDADWWYGCSPTSAGMMIGLYDRQGYAGLTYDNLVPGGDAEASTFGNPSALLNDAIASAGHIADFWVGYGQSGNDPLASGRTIPGDFDSLADFMGTSQDAIGIVDGGTTFWHWTSSGARFTAADAFSYGVWGSDGMYGIGEYIQYAGYSYSDLYTQLTDNRAVGGFTLADFMTEIDAGRTVIVQVQGHSMCGYGYDDAGNILVRDTWVEGGFENGGTMAWGGSYDGLAMWGVTCLTLTGGDGTGIPDGGATIALLGAALAALGGLRKMRS